MCYWNSRKVVQGVPNSLRILIRRLKLHHVYENSSEFSKTPCVSRTGKNMNGTFDFVKRVLQKFFKIIKMHFKVLYLYEFKKERNRVWKDFFKNVKFEGFEFYFRKQITFFICFSKWKQLENFFWKVRIESRVFFENLLNLLKMFL